MIENESAELESGCSFMDHIATLNLTSGLVKNYFYKYCPENDHLIDPIIDVVPNQSSESQNKPNEPENTALVGGKNTTWVSRRSYIAPNK